MKRANILISLVITLVGVGLMAFQNFTRYKPREISRDARDLYMGDALSSALKEAERAEQKRQLDLEAITESQTGEAISDQAIEKPTQSERKTSSAAEQIHGAAQ